MVNPLKILLVANRHYPADGGSEEVQKHWKRILEGMGHIVEVACTDFKYAHGLERLSNSSEVGVTRFRSFRVVRDPFTFSPKMYGWLVNNSQRFDLIFAFTYGYHTSIFPLLLKSLGLIKTPIVFQPHYGPNKTLPKFLNGIFNLTLGKMCVKSADRLVLMTPKYKVFFKKLGKEYKDMFVIPPYVNFMKKVGENEEESFKRKYSIPSGKKYIISVGRIVEYKGVQFAIQGFSKLRETNPDVFNSYHFIIAGEGDYRSNLEKLSKELNLTENVTFTGRITDEEKEVLYSLSHIFSFLSYSGESFGIVIVEALSAGLPTIACNEGANDMTVINGDNGYIIDYNKADEFSNAIVKLNSSLPEFSVRAIDSIEKYREENIVKGLDSLISSFSSPTAS